MTAILVAPPWAPAYHEINLTVSRGDLEALVSLALAWDLPLRVPSCLLCLLSLPLHLPWVTSLILPLSVINKPECN